MCFAKNLNAYGTGGTAGRVVAALMAVAETESVRRAEYNTAFVLLEITKEYIELLVSQWSANQPKPPAHGASAG